MLAALPLLLIPVALYNIVVLFNGSDVGMAQADAILSDPLFTVTMASGAHRSRGETPWRGAAVGGPVRQARDAIRGSVWAPVEALGREEPRTVGGDGRGSLWSG